jgi:hypothetical protein
MVGGAVFVGQGALMMGYGFRSVNDMPQIILTYSSLPYGKDTLEIMRAPTDRQDYAMGNIRCQTIFVEYIKKHNGQDWDFGDGGGSGSWNGGTVTNDIVVSKNGPAIIAINTLNSGIGLFNVNLAGDTVASFGYNTGSSGPPAIPAGIYLTALGTRGLYINGGSGGLHLASASNIIDIDCALRFNNTTGNAGQVLTSNGIGSAPYWLDVQAVWNGGTVTNDIVLSKSGLAYININSTNNNTSIFNIQRGGSTIGSFGSDLDGNIWLTSGAISGVGVGLHISSGNGIIDIDSKLRFHETPGNAGQVLTSNGDTGAPYWLDVQAVWNGGTITNDVVLQKTGPAFININSSDSSSAVFNLLQNNVPMAAFGVSSSGNVSLGSIGSGVSLSISSGSGIIDILSALRFNNTPGNSGQVLTSNGAGSPPYWLDVQAVWNGGTVSNDISVTHSNIAYINVNSTNLGCAFNVQRNGTTNGAFGVSPTGIVSIQSSDNNPFWITSSNGTITIGNISNVCNQIRGSAGGLGIFPYSNGNGNLGGNGVGNAYYWGAVYTDYLGYRQLAPAFDSIDDLTLVRNYKTKNVVTKCPHTGADIYREVIDVENSLPHLLDENGFMSPSSDVGFLLGCTKFLVLRLEKAEDRIAELEKILLELKNPN